MNYFNRFFTLALLMLSCLIIPLQSIYANTVLPDDQNGSIHPPDSCQFKSNPIILRDQPGSFLQVWVEEYRPVFDEPVLPESESLHQFRDQIRQILDTDPLVILENQRSQVTGGDAVNVDLVLKGDAGTVRKMSCLEGILFSHLTDRSISQGKSMYTDPTEFLSYGLTKGDSLKIYFYTVDQPGIGGLSVFDDLLEQDLNDGWIVTQNLHNHNFFPGTEMVLGGVVPGAGDVGAFRSTARRYGANNATITNGFHSIDMTSDDFLKFSSVIPGNSE